MGIFLQNRSEVTTAAIPSHHSEKYWPDARAIKPKRFAKDAKLESKNPFIYILFLAGLIIVLVIRTSSVCDLVSSKAMQEATVVLSMIIQNFGCN